MNIHLLIVMTFMLFACSKDDSGSSSSGGGSSQSASEAGTLILGQVTGKIEPKAGAPAETASGALVTSPSRPDISGETDADGNFEITNVGPGTVSLLVTSSTATGALNLSGDPGAKYGLKLDDIVISSGNNTDIGTNTLKETGSLSGQILFFENPNNLDLTGIEVFIPGTSYIAKTDNEGKFTLTGIPEGTYDLRAQRDGFSVLDIVSIEILEAKTTEMDVKYLSLSTGPEGGIAIKADHTATKDGQTIKIAKSRLVNIQLSFDSDSALMKISDEPSFLNAKWVAVNKAATWEFSSDGPKSLYVQYSDLNGLESSPFSEEFYVDTQVPTLTSATLVNGWDQVGSLNVFLDLVSSDSGTGIESIIFSNSSADFNSGEAWQSYTGSRMNWALASGADSDRTVYVKVRDFAGNESSVVSDVITKGSTTIIKNMTYDFDLTFYKAQSPYSLATTVSFLKPVTIEAGVTIDFNNTQAHFQNYVTAIGTVVDPIVFENTFFRNDSSTPAVTEKTHMKYVQFKGFSNSPKLGGGLYENVNFDGTDSTYSRWVYKYGSDVLTIKNSTFNKLSAFAVNGGTKTILDGNTVDADVFVRQEDNAEGTVTKNNTITQKTGSTQPVYYVSKGAFTSQSDSVTGSSSGVVFQNNAGASSFDAAISVSGLTVNGCKTVFHNAAVSSGVKSITVDGAVVSNCQTLARNEYFANGSISLKNIDGSGFDYLTLNDVGGSGSVSIDRSKVSVDKAFLAATWLGAGLSVTNSDLTCNQVASQFCDIVYVTDGGSNPTATITLTNNKITCSGDTADGCRGFTMEKNSAAGATLNSTISGNFWNTANSGKTINQSNLNTALTSSSPLNSEVRAYVLGGHTISASTGTWPPTVSPVGSEASLNDFGLE